MTELTNIPEVAIAQSILPWNRDDSRARYLSYRASGFTIRESLKLTGNAPSTLSLWRHDPKFVEVEDSLPNIAAQLRTEFTSLEFTRNFRLVLEKDYKTLKKFLYPEKDEVITKVDLDYLLKLRGFYTPQQLQIMEALAKGDTSGASTVGWTEIVLAVRKTEERTMRVRREDAMPQLSQPNNKSEEPAT